MITPRRTRLVRADNLHQFRRAITGLSASSPAPLVVVPTRAAARLLMRGAPFIDAVTRDELYDRLHERLDSPPRRLTALERDVVAQAAARSAASRATEL